MKNPQRINLEKLKKIFEDQRQILFDLHVSIENMQRLKIDKYEYEKEIKLKSFFQNYWFQCKFISVIQLSKLLSDNPKEKRSFRTLARLLRRSDYCDEITNLLKSNEDKYPKICTSKDDVKQITKTIIKSLDEQELLIKKLITLRNKIYAHKDEVNLDYGIISKELFLLSDLAKKIYNQFSINIFWTELRFDITSIGGIDAVLFHMNYSEEKDLEEKKLKKKPSCSKR